MKAGEDLTIIIDKKSGAIVPYKSGDSKRGLIFETIKKGEVIPTKFLKRFIDHNLELIDGVIYKDKVPTNLPKGIWKPELFSKKMVIKKRKYSQTSLTELYNEKGFSALKKIGEEFGVTDRSYRRLINEILTVQTERQRKGL